MTQRTEELLRNSGWNPERCISITQYEEHLSSNGYLLSPLVKKFLQEFGGLKVRFPHPRLRHPTWFYFDPIKASRTLLGEDVDDYGEMIGEQDLVPIGVLDSNLTLLMGPSGKVYGVFDDIIMQYGANGYEGLECLCRERSGVRLQ